MKNFLPFFGYLLLALPAVAQRDCRSFDYRQTLLKNDPRLAVAVSSIEQFTREQVKSSSVTVTGGEGERTGSLMQITIPVVVHVVYNTSNENISDAQVQSQIDVLNADYQKLNADTA